FIGVAHVWPREVTEHIRFAAARRARACAPQHLDFQIRFRSVVPSDGHLVPNLLNVSWVKTHLNNYLATYLGGKPKRCERWYLPVTIPSVSLIFHQRWPCQREPAWRLLRLQSENRSSFPWKAAAV